MVTWQFFFISWQLYLTTHFFPEHLPWVLPRIAWTLINAENFNNFFIGKMSTLQNVSPPPPHPTIPYALEKKYFYWRTVLFSILELHDERKYYMKKVLYFLKKFWNINVANIRHLRILHKTLSRPLYKSACVFGTQSYRSCITDCQ